MYDHEYTDEIVCPHCGTEYNDSWEWEEGEHECDDCEHSFTVERIVTVQYTTRKIK